MEHQQEGGFISTTAQDDALLAFFEMMNKTTPLADDSLSSMVRYISELSQQVLDNPQLLADEPGIRAIATRCVALATKPGVLADPESAFKLGDQYRLLLSKIGPEGCAVRGYVALLKGGKKGGSQKQGEHESVRVQRNAKIQTFMREEIPKTSPRGLKTVKYQVVARTKEMLEAWWAEDTNFNDIIKKWYVLDEDTLGGVDYYQKALKAISAENEKPRQVSPPGIKTNQG
jgi:hypothetical protein